MFKALLKKQLFEFFSGFFVNTKNGKTHTKASKYGFVILFSFLIGSFLTVFISMAIMMAPILTGNNAWLYYSVFGILASMFGLFGSVFLAYNTLYEAKDNDLLLSLPVRASVILLARMSGLYISTFAFETMVMLPAVIVGLQTTGFSAASFILQTVNLFVLPLFSLAVACILGWIIALFSSVIRNKSIVTVIVSISFFAVYYFFSMKISVIIEMLIYNSDKIGEWIKTYIYPLYLMGAGCRGKIISFIFYLLIVAAVFGIVYKILSSNFFRLASVNKGGRKKVYKDNRNRVLSHKLACLKKEFLLYRSIPSYILNCSLGSVLILVFTGFAVVKGEDLFNAVSVIGFSEKNFPLLYVMVLFFISSTNNITAPSVSLEAKNLWLLKSVPINIRDVLDGKILLHVTVTGIPFLVADIVCGFVFDAGLIFILLSAVAGMGIITLSAVTGLMLNLIFPKFDWTNETVPIKQSMASFLSMFTGIFFNMIYIVPVFVTSVKHPMYVYVASALLLYFLTGLLIYRWIMKEGVNKFYNF